MRKEKRKLVLAAVLVFLATLAACFFVSGCNSQKKERIEIAQIWPDGYWFGHVQAYGDAIIVAKNEGASDEQIETLRSLREIAKKNYYEDGAFR